MDRGQTSATTDAIRPLLLRGRLPAGAMDRDGGVQRPLLHDRCHLPGRQPARADHGQGRRRRRQRAQRSSASAGRIDWGVHAYDPTGDERRRPPQRRHRRHGQLRHDPQRARPAFAAVEDWQPGVSDLPVDLYAPVDCRHRRRCAAVRRRRALRAGPRRFLRAGRAAQHATSPRPGSGPTGCMARDVDGDPLRTRRDEQVLPNQDPLDPGHQNPAADCIEAPPRAPSSKGLLGVDGNYGFGDGCFTSGFGSFDPDGATCAPIPANHPGLPAGDYLVKVGIPKDGFATPDDPDGRPLYKFTGEEDINIGNGDAVRSPRCHRPPAPARCTRSTSPTTGRTAIPRSSATAASRTTSPSA